jgi:hypothetical protein
MVQIRIYKLLVHTGDTNMTILWLICQTPQSWRTFTTMIQTRTLLPAFKMRNILCTLTYSMTQCYQLHLQEIAWQFKERKSTDVYLATAWSLYTIQPSLTKSENNCQDIVQSSGTEWTGNITMLVVRFCSHAFFSLYHFLSFSFSTYWRSLSMRKWSKDAVQIVISKYSWKQDKENTASRNSHMHTGRTMR